jgi:hypothetical protein
MAAWLLHLAQPWSLEALVAEEEGDNLTSIGTAPAPRSFRTACSAAPFQFPAGRAPPAAMKFMVGAADGTGARAADGRLCSCAAKERGVVFHLQDILKAIDGRRATVKAFPCVFGMGYWPLPEAAH